MCKIPDTLVASVQNGCICVCKILCMLHNDAQTLRAGYQRAQANSDRVSTAGEPLLELLQIGLQRSY